MSSILVIDDDPEIRELMERVLSSDTNRVQTADSGKTGMQLLRESPFDIVITDILMPDFDGFEVIMEINSMEPRPRLIAMTGGSVNLSREYLLRVATVLKVEQVLHKPFTVEQLQKVIC